MSAQTSTSELCTIIVGAGWSGILAAVKLQDEGLKPNKDFIVLDAASGPGGVWHWNSYPGACVDVESYNYFPLLSRTKFVPSRAFPSRKEILHYVNLLIDHEELRPCFKFGHFVQSLRYDEDAQRWDVNVVVRNRERQPEIDPYARGHDDMSGVSKRILHARHVIVGGGPLSYPKTPDFPGLADFRGPVLHTQRWDHTQDAKFAGKRVGVVGVGCSSAQVITSIIHDDEPKGVKELFVFQRTASWVLPRVDQETPDDVRAAILHRNSEGIHEDYTRRARQLWDIMHDEKANKNFCDRLTLRLQDIVKDQETAAALVPTIPFFGKRPLVMDNYWQTYNDPRVHLVHDPKGVKCATRTGLVTGSGRHVDLDVIVCGSGFEFTRPAIREVYGVGGVEMNSLFGYSRCPKDGVIENGHPKTVLGMHVPKFPNLYFVIGQQALNPQTNVTYVCMKQAEHIASVIREAEQRACTVHGSPSFAEFWTRKCGNDANGKVWHRSKNWYNNYGTADLSGFYWGFYLDYFQYVDKARTFISFEPRRPSSKL